MRNGLELRAHLTGRCRPFCLKVSAGDYKLLRWQRLIGLQAVLIGSARPAVPAPDTSAAFGQRWRCGPTCCDEALGPARAPRVCVIRIATGRCLTGIRQASGGGGEQFLGGLPALAICTAELESTLSGRNITQSETL